MEVFVAGAPGLIGMWLVPQLLDAGHEVIGTTRSPEKTKALRALGAHVVLVDPLDEKGSSEWCKRLNRRRLFTNLPH